MCVCVCWGGGGGARRLQVRFVISIQGLAEERQLQGIHPFYFSASQQVANSAIFLTGQEFIVRTNHFSVLNRVAT